MVTEEKTMIPHARLTGTAAERRSMERKWCERLWQAMPSLPTRMRRNRLTIRAVERAAKRQRKRDERQTKALLAKARDRRAHVLDPLGAESVARQAALVKECLREARALAKSKGETLPWLECLPSGYSGKNCEVLFLPSHSEAPTYQDCVAALFPRILSSITLMSLTMI